MKDTIYQSSDGTKIDHLLERSTLFAGSGAGSLPAASVREDQPGSIERGAVPHKGNE